MKAAIFIFATALMAGSGRAAEAPIAYSLTPVVQKGRLPALEVEMHFIADADGRTELDLPASYGGAEHLYDGIKDLRILGAARVEALAPETRILTSKPLAGVRVTYRLLADGSGTPEAGRDAYPAIGPDRFHIFGPAIFASLDGRDAAPVRFRWHGTAGWRFASDLEHLAPDAGQDDIIRSILVGGRDLDVHSLETAHTTVRFAGTGAFDFDRAEFDAQALKVIETEQVFWGDYQKDFLVTLWPVTDKSSKSFRGTGLHGAFSILTTPGVPADGRKITLAHEFFHHWNPFGLGGAGRDGRWFGEGFTDYYARKMALCAGIVDLKG